MRAGGLGVKGPFISVRVSDTGVRLGPRWRALGIVIPTFEFAWRDVERVLEVRWISGPLTGVRFLLRRAPSVRGGLVMPWSRLVRRPEVWLSQRNTEQVLAQVPPSIPRSQRLGVLFWPERWPWPRRDAR